MVQPTSPARGPRKFNQRVRFVFKIIVCKSSADVQPMISQYSANNHHDFSQPFQACLSTDISANATWMATIRTEPRAQILPPLSDTVGWSFLSYLYDLLHGLWLGIGRDAVGAWVLDLIELSEDVTLESLFTELCDYCQRHGLSHGLDGLSWADFGIADSFSYPHFGKKAYSCKIFASFLAERLQAAPGLERQAACAWHLCEFQRICDSAGNFLSDDERLGAVQAGQLFLDFWAELAHQNYVALRANYKLRPKHHAFAHWVVHRLRAGSRMNPRLTSCWLDEDYVGRVCRTARGTHSNSLGRRTLERVLLEMNRRRANAQRSERRLATSHLAGS